jgi:FtsP/CotA-like multicopper oxidase with cupredoxin domain
MPAPLRALGLTAVALAAAGTVGSLGLQWHDSRLPGTYSLEDVGTLDYGGGRPPGQAVPHGAPGHDHAGMHPVSVTTLKGPRGVPDARFALTAAHTRVRLPSGRQIDALTFNGRLPGPELRVRRGDLVEVTLRNRDVESGVSLHWHGVDVPNGEDGVSGVTQDAVRPGGRHVYRFRADQAGSFWYHTHQSSAREVKRGLFGAFVVEPAGDAGTGLDLAVLAHQTGGVPTLNGADGASRRAVAPGTPVRLRLTNTDSTRVRFAVSGAPFRVAAIDATDVVGPTPLTDTALDLAAGGRYDVSFEMPARPVVVGIPETNVRLVLSPDGRASGSTTNPARTFDAATYGRPAPAPFGAASRFQREFEYRIDKSFGFRDGRPGRQWTVNGGVYPDVPIFVVERGDLVKTTIVNETSSIHPMHLHGHHMLVLSRDGRRVTGSPWWVDTLDVGPHERYEVAFRADNPGLWMDHCHNLQHAAEGLTVHLAYAGVTTPFDVGGHSHNRPE